MKISLALGQRRRLDSTTAWGCLTANLAVPGCGSLVAGRVSGYFQLLIALTGITISTLFGLKFFLWFISNWSRLQQQSDVAEMLGEVWMAARWALLGILVFFAGLLWALASSLGILRESKKAQSAAPPFLSAERP